MTKEDKMIEADKEKIAHMTFILKEVPTRELFEIAKIYDVKERWKKNREELIKKLMIHCTISEDNKKVIWNEKGRYDRPF